VTKAPGLANLLLLLLASIAFTFGGVCMKYSDGLTKFVPSVLLFLLFAFGAACQAIAMRNSEMAVAYIFVLGLESLFAFALGVVVFGEAANFVRILAVGFITLGIVLLHT
jgi:multidrug transporter EmrE-like cation transporter